VVSQVFLVIQAQVVNQVFLDTLEQVGYLASRVQVGFQELLGQPEQHTGTKQALQFITSQDLLA
jgi:hypothetical protein